MVTAADRISLIVYCALRIFPAGGGVAGPPGVLDLPVVAGGPDCPTVRLPRHIDVLLGRGGGDEEEAHHDDGTLHGWNYGLNARTSDPSSSSNTSEMRRALKRSADPSLLSLSIYPAHLLNTCVWAEIQATTRNHLAS